MLDDEELDAGLVAGPDHRIGILKPQRHRLFDDDMLAGFCDRDGMSRMHAAGSEHGDRVDVVSAEKIVQMIKCRDVKA